MGKGYEHYVPKADLDSSFPDEKEFILISSLEQLEKILNNDKKYMAWDTETSDLSPEKGEIVGFSFAFDGNTGYYVPIRHSTGNNLEEKEALDLFYKKMQEVKKNFLFNMRFDFRFMEFEGYDMSEIPYYDVALGCWFADTNKKMPSLKWSARHFMGWDMQSFEETLGDNVNFQFVNPSDAVDYAGADAIATFGLAGKTLKYYKEAGHAGKADNKILYPLMKFEDHPLNLDVKYLEKLLMEVYEKINELEHDIYSMIGYKFNINSGQQLSEALNKLGLDTGEYTKTGYMSTKKSLIKKLDHPISDKLISYKELSKLANSYIETMTKYAKEKDGKLRFAYKNTIVPTGRLACGGDKKNDYFEKINLQSIPKPSSQMWYVHEVDEKHSNDDNIILGYRFSMKEKSDYWSEGFEKRLNVRRAFLPETGDFYWVSVDFSSQELRIATNLSNEPVWLDAFQNGKDPHKQTAIKLYGEENYDRDKRKKAKGMNFGSGC